jgi:hypothetical protein
MVVTDATDALQLYSLLTLDSVKISVITIAVGARAGAGTQPAETAYPDSEAAEYALSALRLIGRANAYPCSA